jgi:hypothetical protein
MLQENTALSQILNSSIKVYTVGFISPVAPKKPLALLPAVFLAIGKIICLFRLEPATW